MQNFYEMFGAYKFYYYFCPVFRAQMAESVDALVSNTSGFTSMPVRSRLWVLKMPVNRPINGHLFFFVRKWI